MRSGSWIQTTGQNNGHQLRDYSKSSNRSENRPLIFGGTVKATGGEYAAGIGGGSTSICGDISISSDVTSVTATKGSGAPYSIGAGGNGGECGTVTIGGKVTGNISTSPYTYKP